MNQGSWDMVTSVWNVSAVRGTDRPVRLGVAAGLATFVATCLWAEEPVFDAVVLDEVDAVLASFSAAFAGVLSVALSAAFSGDFSGDFSGAALLCGGETLSFGSGRARSLGLDPGFVLSRAASTAALRAVMFLTPLNVSNTWPSSYMIVVGHDMTLWELQRSLYATQLISANRKS